MIPKARNWRAKSASISVPTRSSNLKCHVTANIPWKFTVTWHFKLDDRVGTEMEAPRDGEYTVEIHDSIFRGREDFVYRLAIGELPFVTGIFPLGGKAGERTTVALTGW